MPSYSTASPVGIYPGDTVALVNSAATDASVTNTIAVVVAAVAGISGANQLTLTNTTNQTVTVYGAAADYPGSVNNYKALTDADTGTAITAAAGTTISFTFGTGFLLGHFASAPTSGSVIIAR